MPALFTRTSIRGARRLRSATRVAMLFGSAMSSWWWTIDSRLGSMRCAAATPSSVLRLVRTTRNPCAWSCAHVSSPNPRFAPVTRAVRGTAASIAREHESVPFPLCGARPPGSRPLPLLRRQRGGVVHAPPDPRLQRTVRLVPRGADEEPPRHPGARAQGERLRARFLEERGRLIGLDPDDQVVAVNADAHLAAEEERDAAEHLLLRQRR